MTHPEDPTTPEVLPSWAPPAPAYGYPYPYAQLPATNGMSIAAMVVSIVAIASICATFFGSLVLGPTGAILGHVARRQIKLRGESGDAMALTGIIVGWIGFALGLLLLAAFVGLFIWAGQQPPTDIGE